jgi:hypothetical protein
VKRKLKQEFRTQPKDEAEFEETLLKLTAFGRMKIKFEEFTQVDKSNLVDLFVNNEKVLKSICGILFGPKQTLDIKTVPLAEKTESPRPERFRVSRKSESISLITRSGKMFASLPTDYQSHASLRATMTKNSLYLALP